MKNFYLLLLLFIVSCNSTNNNTSLNGDNDINEVRSTNNSDLTNDLFIANFDKNIGLLKLRHFHLTKIPDFCSVLSGNSIELTTDIDLGKNELVEINSAIGCFDKLIQLDLAYNNLTFINNLENLSLEKLLLHKNNISDIVGLSGLNSLRELNLGYNNISNLSGLSGLTGLEILELQHNQITDISPLYGLKSLKKLKLEFNQISELSETDLEFLSGIKFVSIGENPLNGKLIQMIQDNNIEE